MSEEKNEIQKITVEFLKFSCKNALDEIESLGGFRHCQFKFDEKKEEAEKQKQQYKAIAATIANAEKIVAVQLQVLAATEFTDIANAILNSQKAIEDFKKYLRDTLNFGEVELVYGVL